MAPALNLISQLRNKVTFFDLHKFSGNSSRNSSRNPPGRVFMKRRNGDVYLERLFVRPGQKIALLIQIKFVKVDQIVEIHYLIILIEDMIFSLNMPDMFYPLLITHD